MYDIRYGKLFMDLSCMRVWEIFFANAWASNPHKYTDLLPVTTVCLCKCPVICTNVLIQRFFINRHVNARNGKYVIIYKDVHRSILKKLAFCFHHGKFLYCKEPSKSAHLYADKKLLTDMCICVDCQSVHLRGSPDCIM